MNPLIAPDNEDYNWLEDHHQEHIINWLRGEKEKSRLSFDIGMEGVRISSVGLRRKLKRLGMDKGQI